MRTARQRAERAPSFVLAAAAAIELERQRRSHEPPPGPGFHGLDARLRDHQGREYECVHDDVPFAEQLPLVERAVVVVIDPCGCHGGCGLEWPGDAYRARLIRGWPSAPGRSTGWVEEWRDSAGEVLAYLAGDLPLPAPR